MKKLKTFLFALVLFLVGLQPVLCQSYYITEEQLKILENQSNEQKRLIATLEKQLNDCQTQLTQAEKSLTIYENRNLTISITVGATCLFAGFISGVLVNQTISSKN